MNDSNNENKSSRPNYNPYWIYGLVILLILIFFNALSFVGGGPERISLGAFEDIAKKEQLEKVVVLHRKNANLYLKKQYLDDYPDIKTSKINFNQPHFTVEFGDIKTFDDIVKEINSTTKGRILDVYYESPPNWIGDAMSWLIPIFLIIGLWVFFLRRMGGGAGGPGSQIFNIGKSKATLFDNNAKVTRQITDRGTS